MTLFITNVIQHFDKTPEIGVKILPCLHACADKIKMPHIQYQCLPINSINPQPTTFLITICRQKPMIAQMLTRRLLNRVFHVIQFPSIIIHIIIIRGMRQRIDCKLNLLPCYWWNNNEMRSRLFYNKLATRPGFARVINIL